MITIDDLSRAFARNLSILQRQTEGLSHEDSLLQPSPRGNCLNWVLGHIIVNRDRVLALFGEEPVLSAEQTARYRTESEPITGDGPSVMRLDQLMPALDRSQQRVAGALERLVPGDLDRNVQVGERTSTMGQRLFFLYFHEVFHTGQTELLRQLAGKTDKLY